MFTSFTCRILPFPIPAPLQRERTDVFCLAQGEYCSKAESRSRLQNIFLFVFGDFKSTLIEGGVRFVGPGAVGAARSQRGYLHGDADTASLTANQVRREVLSTVYRLDTETV